MARWVEILPANKISESAKLRTLFRHNATTPAQINVISWTNKWNTFCSEETDRLCSDIPLYRCSSCKQYSFWLFFVLLFVLALWILITNSFVIAWIAKSKRSQRTSMHYLKASLAFTDVLTGVMLLCIPLPNIIWTLKLTSKELYVETRQRANTPYAIIGSFFFLLCLSSTLYHLVLMSYNRFSAIMWPTTSQKPRHLTRKLVILWMLAMIAASYPTWFPGSFNFYYLYFTFLYLPNISITTATHLAQAFGLFTIILIPYLAMTVFTIATACRIHKANCNARELSESVRIRTLMINREKAVYKTLTLMELGFTLTLVPSLIVLGLTYTDHGHSIAYIFMVYLALCNSAINVLIYRARDEEFQKFIRRLSEKSLKKIRSSLHRSSETSVVV